MYYINEIYKEVFSGSTIEDGRHQILRLIFKGFLYSEWTERDLSRGQVEDEMKKVHSENSGKVVLITPIEVNTATPKQFFSSYYQNGKESHLQQNSLMETLQICGPS